jgi:xanthine dehydrogenase molybdenum-binding subunit
MVDEFGAKLNVIGTRNKDYVADDIVRGEHIFGEDVDRPGKLFARYLGSRYAKAKINSINTAKAEALEGVVAVVTYKDVSTWSDQILCAEQEIAAVAAVDEDTAERALDLIEVTYDVQVQVTDPDEALKPTAANTGIFPNTNVTPTASRIEYGDVTKGFTAADVTMEELYGYCSRHTHNQIEPYIAMCWWEGDNVFQWDKSQQPFAHRSALASALKMPLHKVHIYNHGTGGGFGNASANPMAAPAAVLSKKTGRPIIMKCTRRQYTVLGNHQYGVKSRIKMGCKNDGTLTALEMEFWNDGGKNGGRSTFCDVAQSTWVVPNFKADHWGIATNTGPTGPWRGVQHPAAAHHSDLALEKMADRLKINPLVMRRKIFLDANPVWQINNQSYASTGLRPCLEKAVEVIGYTAKYHAAGTKTLPDGRLHGIGIHADYDSKGGMSGRRGVIINMNVDGTVLFNSGAARNMGGPGALGTIIAETIGISYDNCRCADWGNTDIAAEGGMQNGSTHTISNGAAAMVSAQDVRRQLFAVAGSQVTNMLKLWPNTVTDKTITDEQMAMLDAGANKIFLVSDPTKSVTHAQVATAISEPVIGRGVRWDPILRRDMGPGANQKKGQPAVHKTACASAAEVAVDPETGEVELLNFVNVVDSGRTIDIVSTEGQMFSGMQVEWNQAMLWEDVYDPVTGVLLGYNHIHDRLCTTLDIPAESNQFNIVETIDANGPYGCHGIGEPAADKPVTLLNAVNNAIGKWIVSTPLTPRVILRALGKA